MQTNPHHLEPLTTYTVYLLVEVVRARAYNGGKKIYKAGSWYCTVRKRLALLPDHFCVIARSLFRNCQIRPVNRFSYCQFDLSIRVLVQ